MWQKVGKTSCFEGSRIGCFAPEFRAMRNLYRCCFQRLLIFTPICGEMIQFEEHFFARWVGKKTPTIEMIPGLTCLKMVGSISAWG